MPNIFADDYNKKALSSGLAPTGYNESYPVAKVAAIADKIYFGIIPAGVEINQVTLINDALASGTLSLGYEPVDGVSPAADLTAFFNAKTIATAGRFDSVAQPLVLNKAVKLVGTLGGAATLITTKLTVVIAGKGNGVA